MTTTTSRTARAEARLAHPVAAVMPLAVLEVVVLGREADLAAAAAFMGREADLAAAAAVMGREADPAAAAAFMGREADLAAAAAFMGREADLAAAAAFMGREADLAAPAAFMGREADLAAPAAESVEAAVACPAVGPRARRRTCTAAWAVVPQAAQPLPGQRRELCGGQ